MSVKHSALTHELSSGNARPVAAIVYANEVYPDAVFKALVKRCRALGLTLAGVLQHQAFKDGDRRCDVILEDLATGHRTALFENRGAGARGCRLDQATLAEATARVEGSLEKVPQLPVLNKLCSEASSHSSGCKSHQQRSPVAVVVITSNGKGDRPVGSLVVKVPDGREIGRIHTGGKQLGRP